MMIILLLFAIPTVVWATSQCIGYPYTYTTSLNSLTHDAAFLILTAGPKNETHHAATLLAPSHLPLAPPRVYTTLRCATGSLEPPCDVSLSSMELVHVNTTTDANASLVTISLHFSHSTSGPPLTQSSLKEYLTIDGGWGEPSLALVWSTPSTLLITSSPMDSLFIPALRVRLSYSLFVPPAPLPPTLSTQCTTAAGSNQSTCAVAVTPNSPGEVGAGVYAWRSPLRDWKEGTSTFSSTTTLEEDFQVVQAAYQSHVSCAEAPSLLTCKGASLTHTLPTLTVPSECPNQGVPFSIPTLVDSESSSGSSLGRSPLTPLPPLPLPTYSLKGVAAVGARGLRIPARNLPTQGTPWSLCFWLWQWQGPLEGEALGNHRVLLFKGPGGASQQRTPSAWLSANTTRLLLRISTNESSDVGGGSIGEVPVREWVHLCFVWDTSPLYTYTLYINGAMDSRLSVVRGEVVHNEGSLWIGRDGGQFIGTRGLIARLAVYGRALSGEEVGREFGGLAPFLLAASAVTSSSTPTATSNPPLTLPLTPAEALTLQGVKAATDLAEAWGSWGGEGHGDSAALSPQAAFLAKLRQGGSLSPLPCLESALGAPSTSAPPIHSSIHCPSPALLQAWSWTAGWLGIRYDPATGYGPSSSLLNSRPPPLIPPPPTHTHTLYTPKRLGEGGRSGGGSGQRLTPSPKDSQKLADAIALLTPGSPCDGVNFKALALAVKRVEGACAFGGGSPIACTLLAHQRLTPGRHWCPEEVRREAWRWGQSHSNVPSHTLSGSGGGGGGSGGGGGCPLYRDVRQARALFSGAGIGGGAEGLFEWGVAVINGVGGEEEEEAEREKGGGGLGGASKSKGKGKAPFPTPLDSAFGFGLVHLAAAAGLPIAWEVLGKRYESGEGGFPSWGGGLTPSPPLPPLTSLTLVTTLGSLMAVGGGREGDISTINARFRDGGTPAIPQDPELALFYLTWAAQVVEASVYSKGGSALLNYPRLTVDTVDTVGVGERGVDDGVLAHRLMLAEEERGEGWAEAAVFVGDLFYWGARGFPRDRVRALRLLLAAAERGGRVDAANAAAAMLSKGEGCDARNMSHAVELWEHAAEHGEEQGLGWARTRALNGLGYAYFYGSEGEDGGVARNRTLAYQYFSAAAEAGDGDSLFNQGRCRMFGEGTPVNRSAAVASYRQGIHRGSWACTFALGVMLAEGGVPFAGSEGGEDGGAASNLRDTRGALPLMAKAAEAGEWGGLGHAGFQYYLAGDFESASLVYSRSSLTGDERAASNWAYLVNKGLVGGLWGGGGWKGEVAMKLYTLSLSKGGKDSAFPLAVELLKGCRGGSGGVEDAYAALSLLSSAAASGSAAAAFELGQAYSSGITNARTGLHLVPVDEGKAALFYEQSKALAPNLAGRIPTMIAVELQRVEKFLGSMEWITSLFKPKEGVVTEHEARKAPMPPSLDPHTLGVGGRGGGVGGGDWEEEEEEEEEGEVVVGAEGGVEGFWEHT